MTKRLALVLCAVLLSGCTAGMLEALAKDPATVCMTVTTIYGTVKVARTGLTSGNVTCTQDGLTLSPVKTAP